MGDSLTVQRLRAGLDAGAVGLGSVLDLEQEPVADRLAVLGHEVLDPRRVRPWRRRRGVRGVYLHGPVGRGKTWLVDELLVQLPDVVVLRVHAFEAARRLHAGVAQHSGRPGATDRAVFDLLGGAQVVFLDELHAHDPGDAMLLTRVVRATFDAGSVLVATSNYPPHGLLPDPRFHHLVLPLVAALQQHCDVVALEGGPDHRALGHGGGRPRWSSGAWFRPGSPAQLAGAGLIAPQPGDRARVRVGARDLWADAATETVVQLGWEELCGATVSVGDLAALLDRFTTVVLARVPTTDHSTPDERRRFADLVDLCWDRDTRLILLTAHAPEQVLDPEATDHARTASRLSLLPSS